MGNLSLQNGNNRKINIRNEKLLASPNSKCEDGPLKLSNLENREKQD